MNQQNRDCPGSKANSSAPECHLTWSCQMAPLVAQDPLHSTKSMSALMLKLALSVQVTHAPGVNHWWSVHKTMTHISVDLVILLFRVDVTCHSHTSQYLLYINSRHHWHNKTVLNQLLLPSPLVHSSQQVSWSSSSSTYIGYCFDT